MANRLGDETTYISTSAVFICHLYPTFAVLSVVYCCSGKHIDFKANSAKSVQLEVDEGMLNVS